MGDERERRKHPRFQVREGAFAFINNIPFSILNISAGGVKLQSMQAQGLLPQDGMTLGMVQNEENFYLQDIPVRLVRVSKLQGGPSGSTEKPGCFGIQFGELSEQQKTRIDYFISHCCVLKT